MLRCRVLPRFSSPEADHILRDARDGNAVSGARRTRFRARNRSEDRPNGRNRNTSAENGNHNPDRKRPASPEKGSVGTSEPMQQPDAPEERPSTGLAELDLGCSFITRTATRHSVVHIWHRPEGTALPDRRSGAGRNWPAAPLRHRNLPAARRRACGRSPGRAACRGSALRHYRPGGWQSRQNAVRSRPQSLAKGTEI